MPIDIGASADSNAKTATRPFTFANLTTPGAATTATGLP